VRKSPGGARRIIDQDIRIRTGLQRGLAAAGVVMSPATSVTVTPDWLCVFRSLFRERFGAARSP